MLYNLVRQLHHLNTHLLEKVLVYMVYRRRAYDDYDPSKFKIKSDKAIKRPSKRFAFMSKLGGIPQNPKFENKKIDLIDKTKFRALHKRTQVDPTSIGRLPIS